MLHTELNDDVMRCFEEATGILASKPDAPVDLAAVTGIIMAVGEAVCLQLEKNRGELLACHDRLKRMLDAQHGAVVEERLHPGPAEHGRSGLADVGAGYVD